MSETFGAGWVSIEWDGSNHLERSRKWISPGHCKVSVAIAPLQKGYEGERVDLDVEVLRESATPPPPPKPKAPPNLAFTVKFVEPSGNSALDAEEKAQFPCTISNTGNGPAYGVSLTAEFTKPVKGITIGGRQSIGEIGPGETRDGTITIQAEEFVQNQQVEIRMTCDEENGFGPDPISMVIQARALVPPNLDLLDYTIEPASGLGKLRRGEQADVKIRMINSGSGVAKGVLLKITPKTTENVFMPGPSSFTIGELKPGEVRDIEFSFFTNRKYSGDEVAFTASISEERGRFGKNLPISAGLEVPLESRPKMVVEAKPDLETATKPERHTGLSIDIEKNIPQNKQSNRDAIAVVIGISQYQNRDVPDVTYATRDAELVAQYLEKSFGLRKPNILMALNDKATLGQVRTLVEGKLKNYVKPGKSDVFFYFSGHGAPDPETQQPYLIPYECDPNYASIGGYSLARLYSVIGGLEARKTIILLDACFSGGSATGKSLLSSVSPVFIDVDSPAIDLKNGAVITASSGQQLSTWYDEKKHGMFTYFLLKGIQGAADSNVDGAITLAEIDAYLQENIPFQARKLHNREQTPAVLGDDSFQLISFE